MNDRNVAVEINAFGISICVNKLLTPGKTSDKFQIKKLRILAINNNRWQDFSRFYSASNIDREDGNIDYGWISLDSDNKQCFANLRNQLYHSLGGDYIDRVLDNLLQDAHKKIETAQKNILIAEQNSDPNELNKAQQELENARKELDKHPSNIALSWLNYLVDLSGIREDVNEIKEKYQEQYNALLEQLF